MSKGASEERMEQRAPAPRRHDHAFGQDVPRAGERRTLVVIAITASMMVVEIAAGILFGSMALLADGLHMASHAAALTVTAIAYRYARRHARDERYSFGTGKVNALGGFTSAVLLALFALLMVSESVARFLHPVPIQFDQAILVAVLGLVVNGASVLVLDVGHGHGHDHEHDAERLVASGAPPRDATRGGAAHTHSQGHTDHNLRAAYFHVLADALTSLLAIFALLAGKFLGLSWMDPAMGVVGAILVARWSWGLLRMTGGVLLDRQASPAVLERVRRAIEDGSGDEVVDLHVWSIGPGLLASSFTVVTDEPGPPERYRGRLPGDLGLVHTVVEVHRRRG